MIAYFWAKNVFLHLVFDKMFEIIEMMEYMAREMMRTRPRPRVAPEATGSTQWNSLPEIWQFL